MKNKLTQKNIPTGWQQVKLGDCLVIKHGKSQKEIEVLDGKYPILATGGVIGRTNTPLYSKPSVLIGRKGTIDKPRYMDTPFWTVDTLFYSQIKENSIPKYLFYKFNTIEWYDYNEASGVPSLSATTISSIKFNLPSLFEQNRIVAVLETWDRAIEKLVKKIEVKKEIKKSLMQDLLTGKKRLSGFNDKWENKMISDIFLLKKGSELSKEKLDSSGKFECILYGELYTTYDEVICHIKSKTNISEGTPSKAGDILIPASTTTGAIDLAIATSLDRDNVLLGGDINILRSKKKIDSRFFAYYLTHAKKHNLARLAQGVTIVHLYSSDFKNIEIEVPKIEEQTAIADIITTAEKEIAEMKNKLSLLKDQKKYLLNNLITGTIRTPEKMKVKT